MLRNFNSDNYFMDGAIRSRTGDFRGGLKRTDAHRGYRMAIEWLVVERETVGFKSMDVVEMLLPHRRCERFRQALGFQVGRLCGKARLDGDERLGVNRAEHGAEMFEEPLSCTLEKKEEKVD
jgi:hypothetical protein